MRWYEYKMETDDLCAPEDLKAKLLAMTDQLTEEEKTVCRRGRNAKSGSMAKNATMKEYRMATGFEALVGYLYLAERFDRLTEVVSLGLEKIGELKEEDGR